MQKVCTEFKFGGRYVIEDHDSLIRAYEYIDWVLHSWKNVRSVRIWSDRRVGRRLMGVIKPLRGDTQWL